MMVIRFFLFLLIFPAIITGCSRNGTEMDQEIILTEKAAKLVEADNQFGIELFRKIVAAETGTKNIMVSPLSVSLALAMTYNGAEGKTKDDMERTLKLYGLTRDEINRSYQSLTEALKSVDPKVLLEIANAIFYRDDFAVEKNFVTLNKLYYNAEISPLDFASPAAVGTINGWVDEKTHGKIKTIIDRITREQVMFLLNAIYFKGIWEKEFNQESTQKYPFETADGRSVEVDMMQRLDTLDYMSNEIFSAIRLPYGKGNYNMYVLLPGAGKTVHAIETWLDSDKWESWLDEFSKTMSVDIRLPKFRFGYEIRLNDILAEMGMGIAFTPGADFTGINREGGLAISYVKHKTFVEVNEEGTEAAAVTIVAIERTSAGPSKIPFYINRPFLFAITEKDTGAILFIGKVNNPAES